MLKEITIHECVAVVMHESIDIPGQFWDKIKSILGQSGLKQLQDPSRTQLRNLRLS